MRLDIQCPHCYGRFFETRDIGYPFILDNSMKLWSDEKKTWVYPPNVDGRTVQRIKNPMITLFKPFDKFQNTMIKLKDKYLEWGWYTYISDDAPVDCPGCGEIVCNGEIVKPWLRHPKKSEEFFVWKPKKIFGPKPWGMKPYYG